MIAKAAQGGVPGMPGGGGGVDGMMPGGEEMDDASNNLSFPAVTGESEHDLVPEPPDPIEFKYAPVSIADAPTECVTIAPVLDSSTCFWDDMSPDGVASDDEIFYLQKRPEHYWQAFTGVATDHLNVSHMNVGDLLESSINIKATVIRTEFFLSLDARDTEFASCVPSSADYDVNTCQAFPMSEPVPGTEQSINEIKGTNVFAGWDQATPFHEAGRQMSYPKDVYQIRENPEDELLEVHAMVISVCSRLIIQKLLDLGDPVWDIQNDRWANALPPQVDINAWSGTYKPEINASGWLIWGYNWNTKLIPKNSKSGTWRLTYLLDSTCGGRTLNTFFTDDTKLVNVGDRNIPEIITQGDFETMGDEHGHGGAVYIDVELGGTTGGGGGGLFGRGGNLRH